ncbi:MAG: hydrogenase-4 component E [Alphaproteobacteria bacterium]|nr:hydrogenase-4 component E [Alphaproteobacteria bacterium]MCW5742084.1 hydrogenase-4 component E [Alphaproteobacteria bacterium]
MSPIAYDIAHLLGALVLTLSFALLYQRRVTGAINAVALQAATLAAAAAWQAAARDAGHLYATAAIALLFKAIGVPLMLHWLVRKLDLHRQVQPALGITWTMALGVIVAALSILLVLPVTVGEAALAREDLAFALAVALIGPLLMIARRNAVVQVIGFMSMENGLILAAVGVNGMPLVVEASVAFSVMVATLVFGVFFFHIRERFDSFDVDTIEQQRGDRHP